MPKQSESLRDEMCTIFCVDGFWLLLNRRLFVALPNKLKDCKDSFEGFGAAAVGDAERNCSTGDGCGDSAFDGADWCGRSGAGNTLLEYE